MIYDFVFIHGTGVREPAYTHAFNRISEQLKRRRGRIRMFRCFWGADYGTRLFANGASIPGFETKRDPNALLTDEEYIIGLWSLLYQDPLFEVRILAMREEGAEFVPGVQPGQELDHAVRTLAPSPELRMVLIEAGLDTVFDEARKTLLTEVDYEDMIEKAAEPLTEYRIAVARALVAQSVVLAQAKHGVGSVILPAWLRDELVDRLVTELGGRERFISSWVQKKMIGVVKRIATNRIDRWRGIFSEEASGAAGDILMYQAHGQGIRRFIRQTIETLDGPVVVIAHSLGGIAAVDMLIETPIEKPPIRLLVTVGSQAPLLYELNALVSMPYDPHGRLPKHFPPWLNIYDERDFLSYKGSGIFSEVHDMSVNNGQPFPESHCAYWGNDKVWDAILSKLP
jgi:hypothetical protein